MRLDVVLPVRDPAGLHSFLLGLYDPSSPSYRHFLTVQEFTRKFGPSQADYDDLTKFAKTSGFTVVGGSRDGMDVHSGLGCERRDSLSCDHGGLSAPDGKPHLLRSGP